MDAPILERPRSDNVVRVVATVALLFTDIEGSTRLWERGPDAMAIALARHDELLRAAIEAHGGRVFKTVGDAFCAAFAAPRRRRGRARRPAALAAEPWPEARGCGCGWRSTSASASSATATTSARR